MNKILIIGETCIDEYVYGIVERICPEAPVSCFKSDDIISQNLGMASNVKKNIESILGYEVDIITNNDYPIKRRFVDSRYNTIVFRQDHNDKCSRIKISEIDLLQYNNIIISDYCKGFLHPDDIKYISNHSDATIFIDTKKKDSDFLEYVDFVKINSKEFLENFNGVVGKLKNLDVSLIVTNGSYGATLYHKDIIKKFPTQNIEVRDVCGAGDTFMAALVAKYINTKDIEQSIMFANLCASKVVQKFGVCIV